MFKFAIPALALAAAVATPALASVPVYAPVGTVNSQSPFSYAAPSDGNFVVYYLGGRSVGYTHALFASFNSGAWQGPAQSSDSDLEGTAFNFGPVTAGTTVAFQLRISAPEGVAGNIVHSDPSLNSPVQNLFYYAPWGGGSFTFTNSFFEGEGSSSIPVGSYTFGAFEDLITLPGTPRRPIRDPEGNIQDYDYNDYRFAFRIEQINVIPEPATWAMLITGFGLVGFAMRRRKATLSSVSA